MQGHLWTETVRTSDQMYSMIFPRLLALAERAWHKASWERITNKKERDAKKKEDWKVFANKVGYSELGRLDKMGVVYHLKPPGVRVDEGIVEITNAFPGLKFQYSTDGESWENVEDVSKLGGNIYLRTSSVDGRHHSRAVVVNFPNPVNCSYFLTSHLSFLVAVIVIVMFWMWT